MKIIQIVVLVLIFLFVIGCDSEGNGLMSDNFKQGFGSLELNFLDSAPPAKIYPNSNFKMIIELDNQAAYDLKNGKIRLVGIDGKIFSVQPIEEQFNILLGKSLINPAGDKIFKEFSGQSNELFQNAEKYQNSFFLKASFDSVFEFADTLCINPNLYNVFDSGCKVEEKKTYSGQGAPIAVTNLESIIYPSNGGAEVEFRILIKNKGKGEINFVKLNRATLGDKDLKDCKFQSFSFDSQEEIVHFNKEKQEETLICKLFLSNQRSYMTSLFLDLSYGYEVKQKHILTLVR